MSFFMCFFFLLPLWLVQKFGKCLMFSPVCGGEKSRFNLYYVHEAEALRLSLIWCEIGLCRWRLKACDCRQKCESLLPWFINFFFFCRRQLYIRTRQKKQKQNNGCMQTSDHRFYSDKPLSRHRPCYAWWSILNESEIVLHRFQLPTLGQLQPSDETNTNNGCFTSRVITGKNKSFVFWCWKNRTE